MSVSAGNDCYFCMDSHGAFASVLLRDGGQPEPELLVERIKTGSHNDLDEKMRALLAIADTVRRDALVLTEQDVQRALNAGACDADVQLAVMIAAGFSMYNRMVDGLRARTPGSLDAFLARASEIARNGYSSPTNLPPSGSVATPASSRGCATGTSGSRG
jgi:AhpD family alkylhydroperoxidase